MATKKSGGMNLDKVRLVKETPDAWHAHDGKSEFRIAKKGLRKDLSEAISQHFACGGQVQKFDDGGSVDPAAASEPAISTGDATTDAMISGTAPAPASDVPTITGDPSVDAQIASADVPPPKSATAWELMTPGERLAALGEVPQGMRYQAERVANAAGLVPKPIPPVDVQPTTPAPSPGPTPELASAHAPFNPAAPRPSTPPPAPGAVYVPAGGGGSGPSSSSELSASYMDAKNAAQAQADVAKEEAAANLVIQQKADADRAAATKAWQDQLSAWQAKGDAIAKTEIDPNRYWNSKSTAGKIRGIIGIMLGGIGAGGARTQNMALEVIQNAIARDVDAQKFNKESALNQYIQQGHTLFAARQLAIAEAQDAVASQLRTAGFKFAGQKAQVAADQAAASLRADAVVKRQQVAATGLDMSLKGVQLEQARMGVAMGRMQMGALQALTAPQNQGGQPGQSGQRPTMGTRIDPRAIAFLPEELQKKLVTLPDGSYALARDAKGKEEVDKSLEAAGILQDKMRRYSALLAKHPHGVFSTTDPTDYASAKAIYESILTDINSLAGLNRLTDTEVGIFKGRVPDITDKQFRGTPHQAKLSELQQEIADKVQHSVGQYLNLSKRNRIQ